MAHALYFQFGEPSDILFATRNLNRPALPGHAGVPRIRSRSGQVVGYDKRPDEGRIENRKIPGWDGS